MTNNSTTALIVFGAAFVGTLVALYVAEKYVTNNSPLLGALTGSS